MRLTVVGCSGSVPGPASPASCYLVEADDSDGRTWRVALDLGSGALGALQRYCDPRDIDAVAITHLHPDHCADLASLHVYLAYHPDAVDAAEDGSIVPMPVFGPFGTAGRIDDLRGASAHSAVLDCHVWQPGVEVIVGPLRITVEPVRHPVPAYGLRIVGPAERRDEGDVAQPDDVVLAYSGDSDVCGGLGAIAAGADLLLCEATYLEAHGADRGVHLTAADAAELAARAGVGRLVLTHIPPWTDPQESVAEAAASFAGALEVAVPGAHYAL